MYAISWLHQQGKSSDFIAGELKLNVDQVNAEIEKSHSNTNSTIKTGSEPVNLMINKTSGKGNTGVAIMTKEASEKHDAMKSSAGSSITDRKDVIFKPRNND